MNERDLLCAIFPASELKQIFHKVQVSTLSVEQLSCFYPWNGIVNSHKYRRCSPEWLKSPFRLDFPLNLPEAPFPSNSGHYLQSQKEKGQTCCCIQSHSCGQGKGELRENACWICNGKWMNKEVEPSFSFFGQRAAMAFFFVASIRMDGRRRRRRTRRRRRQDLYAREELWWKPAMRTLPAIHWKFSTLTGSNYFWDIKEYTGKEQALHNRFFF